MKYAIFLWLLFPVSLKAATVTIQNSNLTIQNAVMTIQAPYVAPAAPSSGPTLVQSTGNACVGAVCSATFTATVGNNLISCVGVTTGENIANTSFVDKAGNVYTSTAPSAGASSECLGVYKFTATGGSSYWVRFNVAAAGDTSLTCWEISGATALDTSNGFVGASSANWTSQNMLPTASGILVGGITYEGTSTTITNNANLTQDFEQENNSTFQAMNGAHKATTAVSTTYDGTLGAARIGRTCTMVFK